MLKFKFHSAGSIFLLAFLLFSCGNPKKVVYFQHDSSSEKNADTNTIYSNLTVYQTNDLLAITISSIDIETVKPFNLSSSGAISKSDDSEYKSQPTYIIDLEGNIDFPVVGKIKLASLNRQEAILLIKDKLREYVPQANVNIKLVNFNVTVLGDVRRPGTYPVEDENISLLEAIGFAEDLNITGVRKNVLIIREQNGKKIEIRVDLTSSDFLNSEYYYLKQNDVIYVQPNRFKISSGIYGVTASTILSVLSVLLTTLLFVNK